MWFPHQHCSQNFNHSKSYHATNTQRHLPLHIQMDRDLFGEVKYRQAIEWLPSSDTHPLPISSYHSMVFQQSIQRVRWSQSLDKKIVITRNTIWNNEGREYIPRAEWTILCFPNVCFLPASSSLRSACHILIGNSFLNGHIACIKSNNRTTKNIEKVTKSFS